MTLVGSQHRAKAAPYSAGSFSHCPVNVWHREARHTDEPTALTVPPARQEEGLKCQLFVFPDAAGPFCPECDSDTSEDQ